MKVASQIKIRNTLLEYYTIKYNLVLLKDLIKEKHPDLSNREIKRALEEGACKVNGAIERFPNRTINPRKDKISFTYIKLKAKAKLIINKSSIVFEDADILVYDKPAGYACMSTENSKQVNLHRELKKFTRLSFLEPVHRLDKDTSGLMIFAKNSQTLEQLNQMFKDKEIHKEYYAIVDGAWTLAPKGRISNHLQLAAKRGAMQTWEIGKKNNAKAAITDYELISNHSKHACLRLSPQTGRTHQLRVHMSHLGHPIIGDTQYAKNFKSPLRPGRHLLHAHKLKFKHPQTQRKLNLEAPLPEEFTSL